MAWRRSFDQQLLSLTPKNRLSLREENIPAAGGRLFAEISGRDFSPTTATVLFLHGWTLDHRMWARQCAALASSLQLIAIDRRGFGRSTAPADVAAETDDILKVLDFFGVSRAFIVGMSQSGRVAADFALRHPERVAGLTLQGARLLKTVSEQTADEIPLSEFRSLAREGRIDELKRIWRAHPFMRVADPSASSLIDEMLADYDARDLLSAAPPPPDLEPSALARIIAPTLVVTGQRDTDQRRKIADDIARLVPGAKRVEIAGAGHLCNLCAPDEFNRVLSQFVGAHFASEPP